MMDKETKDLLEELKQSNGYISISELAKRFEKIDMLYNHDYWNLTQILANINLIVPVELDVIHCKDCIHWGTGVPGETENIKCCEYGKYMVGENGYCVYGEKERAE